MSPDTFFKVTFTFASPLQRPANSKLWLFRAPILAYTVLTDYTRLTLISVMGMPQLT